MTTRSKMSDNFKVKRALREYADGGLVGNTAEAIRKRREMLDNAGAAPAPAPTRPAPPPKPAASREPTDEERARVGLPPKKGMLRTILGLRDGGMVGSASDAIRKRHEMLNNDGAPTAPAKPAVQQPKPAPAREPTDEERARVGLPPKKGMLRTILGLRDGGAVPCPVCGGSHPGMACGGMAKKKSYETGGEVDGPGGPREDKVPAMLSDGEYVLPAKTVDELGVDNLDALVEETNGRPPLRMQAGGYIDDVYNRALYQRPRPDFIVDPAGGARSTAPIRNLPAVRAPTSLVPVGAPQAVPTAPPGNVIDVKPTTPSLASRFPKVARALRVGLPLTIGAGIYEAATTPKEAVEAFDRSLGIEPDSAPVKKMLGTGARYLRDIGDVATLGMASRVGRGIFNVLGGDDFASGFSGPVLGRSPAGVLNTPVGDVAQAFGAGQPAVAAPPKVVDSLRDREAPGTPGVAAATAAPTSLRAFGEGFTTPFASPGQDVEYFGGDKFRWDPATRTLVGVGQWTPEKQAAHEEAQARVRAMGEEADRLRAERLGEETGPTRPSLRDINFRDYLTSDGRLTRAGIARMGADLQQRQQDVSLISSERAAQRAQASDAARLAAEERKSARDAQTQQYQNQVLALREQAEVLKAQRLGLSEEEARRKAASEESQRAVEYLTSQVDKMFPKAEDAPSKSAFMTIIAHNPSSVQLPGSDKPVDIFSLSRPKQAKFLSEARVWSDILAQANLSQDNLLSWGNRSLQALPINVRIREPLVSDVAQGLGAARVLKAKAGFGGPVVEFQVDKDRWVSYRMEDLTRDASGVINAEREAALKAAATATKRRERT